MAFLLKYIKGKKATVLGAGASGLAAAQLLYNHALRVNLCAHPRIQPDDYIYTVQQRRA